MLLNTTEIENTFAEAFRMRWTRVVVTAHDEHWLNAALAAFTGFGTSVIACDVEAGLERRLSSDETPDGRPGAAVLMFGFATQALADAVPRRAGQCLMTCPTTAVFNGLHDAEEKIALGKHIRYFGDGFQRSKLLDGRRYWRVPVMDGEFLAEDYVGVGKGVAGGNLIIQAAELDEALNSARRAVAALADMPGVITPFPGGVARSGSKVGSRYKKLRASTAEAFCPTLRGQVETQLHPQANHALEVVIDGVDEAAVGAAMAAAIRAAAGPGVVRIGAGNYGGKLGKFHFRLHEVLNAG